MDTLQAWQCKTSLRSAEAQVVGAVGHAVQVGLARHHAEGVHVRGAGATAAAQRHRAVPPAAGTRVVHEPERRVLAHALHAYAHTPLVRYTLFKLVKKVISDIQTVSKNYFNSYLFAIKNL